MIIARKVPKIIDLSTRILLTLIGNNKQEEAKRVLHKIARRNRRELSTAQMKEIEEILQEMALEDRSTKSKKLSPLHMFKQHYISRGAIQ